jgi:hypothetical protein
MIVPTEYWRHVSRSTRVEQCIRVLCVVALVAAAVGCSGNDEARFVAVSGKVKLNGRPLDVGTVSFHPDASKGNKSMHIPYGQIDADGNYELTTIKKKGAPPGWYKVVVFADGNADPSGKPPTTLQPPKLLTNTKYADEKSTDLVIEVVAKPEPGAYDLNVSK